MNNTDVFETLDERALTMTKGGEGMGGIGDFMGIAKMAMPFIEKLISKGKGGGGGNMLANLGDAGGQQPQGA